jgi:hypothetical protein
MSDRNDPWEVKAACIRGLGWGLEHARPDVEIDDRGRLRDFGENFPPYMEYVCGAGEIGSWMDDLLEEYMLSVGSSATLTVNCFGPLMMAGLGFSIGSHRELHLEGFERGTRNGFQDAEEPHLEVIASGPSGLVVIDPTCIDYLATKRPRVTEQNQELTTSVGAKNPWAAEMLRIREGEQSYRLLDAEHLIGRALSVSRSTPGEPATLVYLYWEPMDEGLSPLFEEHRQEIAAFADRVAGGSPRFEALSWFDLWNDWSETGDPLLQRQVAELRARYEVPAWAWEGVSWADGRLTNSGLEDW